VGGGSVGGNVSFSVSEQSSPGLEQGASSVTLDQTTINQIVSGLQQASSTGVTQLQSRDISRSTDSITHDAHVQPNYIPPQTNVDYITDQQDNNDIIQRYNKESKYGDNLDQLYDEIQIPLLISVLYFLFQLPIFKRYLYRFFPVLFSKDVNINIYGYIFTSVLFGLLYYLLSKTMFYFSKF
jgi:ATP-dependent Zn protease